jgi:hypothetical protein
MPFLVTAASSARRRAAYEFLGVAPNDVADAPRISNLIAKIPGGRPAALEALRASDLKEARAFISVYDNILMPSSYRKQLPIEAFALAAKLSPTRLFGVIAEVFRLQKMQLGAIKAASRHEAIVDVSSTVAATPEGVEDRMAHLKHMGFTPSPKGSTINIGIAANATANSASRADAASALAPSEDTIRRMVEARQRSAALASATQHALPAASAESVPMAFQRRPAADRVPVTVDAEYSEESDD